MNKLTILLIALLSYSLVNAQWYQQYPEEDPAGYSYNDVFFVDALNGWAVGLAGVIMYTSDGGETWHLQAELSTNTLNNVVFMNLLTGWIVGGRGNDKSLILHTDDGGETWDTQLCDSGSVLNSVSFVDNQNGWAVGGNDILHTSDGGMTWEKQSGSFSSPRNYISVCFVDALQGWISAFSDQNQLIILNTTDGGLTWIDQYTGGDLYGINYDENLYFVDAEYGWIIDENQVLKTTDGGMTYEMQLPGGCTFINLHFTDRNNGWVIGWHTYQPNGGCAMLYCTNDGGGSWQENSLFINQGAFPSLPTGIHFVNEKQGWIVYGSGDIRKSTDGGQNWKPQVGTWNSEIRRLSFTDTLNGWAVGIRTVLHTKDGGVEWESLTNVPTCNYGYYFDVKFFDHNTGWILSRECLLHTSDEGTSWDLRFNFDDIGVHSQRMSAPDPMNIWILGRTHSYQYYDTAMILHSSDEGTTWQVQLKVPYHLTYLQSIFFIDLQSGWVVGNEGQIYHTSDGGLNWESQSIATEDDLTAVYFLDSLKGWVAGQNGKLFSTLDGGATWEAQPTGLNTFFWDITFSDAVTGWLVGYGGTILRTLDGGVNWALVISGTAAPLMDIAFSDPENGWISGQTIVLNSRDGGNTWETNMGWYYQGLNKVYFADSEKGWALGPSTLLATEDGGENWELQYCGTSNNADFTFADTYTGWLLDRLSGVWKTFDGGTTWQFHPVEANNPLEEICFTDYDNGWIMASAWSQYASTEILHSSDGGNTWAVQYENPDEIMKSMYFIDSLNGWVVGTLLLHTSDGGNSWEIQDSLENYSLVDVCFVDALNGWTVSQEAVYYTSDGGYNWELQNYLYQINGIHFTDLLNGWIIGSSGIWRTQDGGVYWELQCGPFFGTLNYGTLNDVYFTNPEEGWAVGPYSMILHTTNGGLTYTDEQGNIVADNYPNLKIYPNPFNSVTTIEFELEESDMISLKIYNHLGQMVAAIKYGRQPIGKQTIQWNNSALPPGLYICEVITKSQGVVGTGKVIKR